MYVYHWIIPACRKFSDLPPYTIHHLSLPKVHCMTGMPLSFKNQWGCLSDTMRLKNHYVFNEIITQVCNILKFSYAFLDGEYGLDINSPMMSDPVEVNWLVAANLFLTI